MGTGKGLVFSTSLEVYIWIYAMDHCSVGFSPKGNLGTVGKKEMDTKDVYVGGYTPTHPHPHAHTGIFSIRLTVSLLNLN